MVKTACFDDNGMKKGAWSEEEDNKLRAYVQRYGHWNWRLLPKYAGLARCGKSCRLRWVNYLKPGVKRGNFSQHEVDLIMQLHEELGNKWSVIAEKLPGRTDNDIKNYWHAHIKRRNNGKSTKSSKQNCSTSSLNSLQVETPSTDISTPSKVANDHVTKSWDSTYENQLGFWNVPLSSHSINDICVSSLSAEEDIFSSQLHYTELPTPISSSFSNAFEWISGSDHQNIISPNSPRETAYMQGSLWDDQPFLSSTYFSNGISNLPEDQEQRSFDDPFAQVFDKGMSLL